MLAPWMELLVFAASTATLVFPRLRRRNDGGAQSPAKQAGPSKTVPNAAMVARPKAPVDLPRKAAHVPAPVRTEEPQEPDADAVWSELSESIRDEEPPRVPPSARPRLMTPLEAELVALDEELSASPQRARGRDPVLEILDAVLGMGPETPTVPVRRVAKRRVGPRP